MGEWEGQIWGEGCYVCRTASITSLAVGGWLCFSAATASREHSLCCFCAGPAPALGHFAPTKRQLQYNSCSQSGVNTTAAVPQSRVRKEGSGQPHRDTHAREGAGAKGLFCLSGVKVPSPSLFVAAAQARGSSSRNGIPRCGCMSLSTDRSTKQMPRPLLSEVASQLHQPLDQVTVTSLGAGKCSSCSTASSPLTCHPLNWDPARAFGWFTGA